MQHVTPAIRNASVSDSPSLSALMTRAYRGEQQDLDENAVARRLKHGRFLVADESGGAAGAVYVRVEGAVGHIELLAVSPEMRGKGVGRRLLDVAELLCRAEDCSSVRLWLRSDEPELQQACERLGYHPRTAAPANEGPIALEKGLISGGYAEAIPA